MFLLKIQRDLCHPKSFVTFEKRAPHPRRLESSHLQITKAALSPQLFKDPKCWSGRRFQPASSRTITRCSTNWAKRSAINSITKLSSGALALGQSEGLSPERSASVSTRLKQIFVFLFPTGASSQFLKKTKPFVHPVNSRGYRKKEEFLPSNKKDHPKKSLKEKQYLLFSPFTANKPAYERLKRKRFLILATHCQFPFKSVTKPLFKVQL